MSDNNLVLRVSKRGITCGILLCCLGSKCFGGLSMIFRKSNEIKRVWDCTRKREGVSSSEKNERSHHQQDDNP